jgi:hypothetical protein
MLTINVMSLPEFQLVLERGGEEDGGEREEGGDWKTHLVCAAEPLALRNTGSEFFCRKFYDT